MRIVSGSTTASVYFTAVSTVGNLGTLMTGLTSFDVYYSINGSTGTTQASAVTEVNSTQMPGVYRLAITDSTITSLGSGIDSRELCIRIANSSGMVPVTKHVELYRRTVTTGLTLSVTAAGVLGAGAITANSIATDAITAVELSDTAITEIGEGVVDALDVTTWGEPGAGAPPAAPTIRQMIHYLYKAWRNKIVQDSSHYTLYSDDGSTEDQKATVSDSGTAFTRGEVGSA